VREWVSRLPVVRDLLIVVGQALRARGSPRVRRRHASSRCALPHSAWQQSPIHGGRGRAAV